jgi:hypothetical protein
MKQGDSLAKTKFVSSVPSIMSNIFDCSARMKLDFALPTLILRWFNVVKPTPTYSRPLRPFADVGSTSPCRLWVNFDKTTVGIRLFADAWFEYLTYDCLYLNSRFKTRI